MENIKKISIIGAYLLFTAFFALVCNQIYSNYDSFFSLDANLLSLIFFLFFAVSLLVTVRGLITVLIKSKKDVFVCFLLSSLVLIIFLKIDFFISLIVVAIYLLIATVTANGVVKEADNRIKFSLSVVKKGQSGLIMSLMIIASVSFGVGYRDVSEKESFIIPPALEESMLTNIFSYLEREIDAQDLPEEEKESILEEAKEDVMGVVTETSQALQDAFPYVWLIPAFSINTILNLFQFIINIFSKILISALFYFLKKIKVVKIETREVEKEEIIFS